MINPAWQREQAERQAQMQRQIQAQREAQTQYYMNPYGNQQPFNPQVYNQPNQQNAQQIHCMPVSSPDEVKAFMADPMGRLHVFVDAGRNCFYTKQVGVDGTSVINVYTQAQMQEPQKPEYAEKGEIMGAIQQMQAEILSMREAMSHAGKSDERDAGLPANVADAKGRAKPNANAGANDGK